MRSAILSLPGRRIGGLVFGAAALMAAAGLTTQAIAITTGRDFALGSIPAFDPAGSHNLQAWFVSAVLALCAGVAALAAAGARPDSAIQARGWLAIATVCLVWSAQRLTPVAALWDIVPHPLLRPELLTIGAGSIVCAAALRGAADAGGRRLRGLRIAIALFVAGEAVAVAAGAAGLPAGWGRAFALQSSRLIEAVAAGLFVSAVLDYLQTGPHRSVFSARATHAAIARVIRGLTMTAAVVLGISLVVALAAHPGDQGWWHRLLFVDFEGNLPTWFSVLLLLACSVPAATLAALARRRGDFRWRMWAMLAVLFVLLSADEGASLHELMVAPLRLLVGNSPWLRYPLILPGIGAALAIAPVFGDFLASWPLAIRRLFLAGAGLFLIGALGVETVGGWFDPVLHGPSVTYLLLATVEEGCEMIGVITMLRALLGHLASSASG